MKNILLFLLLILTQCGWDNASSGWNNYGFQYQNASLVSNPSVANVGIGSSAPSCKVDLSAGSQYCVAGIAVTGGGGGSGASFAASASQGTIGFLDVQGTLTKIGGNAGFIYTGAGSTVGNIGIGSSNPGQILDVTGTVRATGFTGNASNLTNLPITLTTTGSSGASTWTQGTNTLNIPQYSGGSGTNYWGSNTSGVYPNPSSNVGIGTTLPVGALDVEGTVYHTVIFPNGNIGIGTYGFTMNASNGVHPIVMLCNASGTSGGCGSHAQNLAPSGYSHWEADNDSNNGAIIVAEGSTNTFLYPSGGGFFVGGTSNQYPVSFGVNTSPSTSINVAINGNVGIGTWTPVNTLDVPNSMAIGSYSATKTAPSNSLIVSGNIGVGSFNPGQVLDVNGAIRSTATGISTFGGNVGIGTTLAGNLLNVGGNAVGNTGKAACIGAGVNGPCLGYATAGTYPAATCTCL